MTPDLEQFREYSAMSPVTVYDERDPVWRKPELDELLDAERFLSVWAHESFVAPMQSERDIPLGCLRKIDRAECSEDWPASIIPHL